MDGSTGPWPQKDWLAAIFAAKAARTGGVVRRKASWVEQEIGRARFEAYVRARGFHLVEAGNQLIVICTREPVKILF